MPLSGQVKVLGLAVVGMVIAITIYAHVILGVAGPEAGRHTRSFVFPALYIDSEDLGQTSKMINKTWRNLWMPLSKT